MPNPSTEATPGSTTVSLKTHTGVMGTYHLASLCATAHDVSEKSTSCVFLWRYSHE